MRGFGPSADEKPCRCLFHITPVISNSHFTNTSFTFESTDQSVLELTVVFKPQYRPTARGHLALDQTTAPLSYPTQNPLDHRGVLDSRQETHLAATLGGRRAGPFG